MLSLQHISKSYYSNQVLEDVNLTVNPGEVVALIGRNGVGKTTLLKIVLGEIEPDEGQVMLHNEVVGYVPQKFSTAGIVRESFDPATPPWRIEYALDRVDLSHKAFDAQVASLSGGQKSRLALAVVLARQPEPTVLLLDEPTNNLDAEGLEWLKSFIESFWGGIIVVTHERSFINQVATEIAELEQGQVNHYGGDYDFYKQQKEIERKTKWKEYEQAISEKKKLEKLKSQKYNKMHQVSNKTYNKIKHEDKGRFNARKNATQNNLGQQINALDSRLEQLGKIERPEERKDYKVEVLGKTHSKKRILQVKNLEKSYQKPVFRNVDFKISGSERLLVSGSNGSGKTTLLKIAAGLVKPDNGEIIIGEGINIGYFSQDVDGLDYSQTGEENLENTGADSTSIFHEARSLGLTETDLRKSPSDLSRGQQAKLGFTKILLEANQLLILDEPTNHLDIPTRERVETALQEYDGAMIVASHDQYFVDQIAIDRVLKLEDNEATLKWR